MKSILIYIAYNQYEMRNKADPNMVTNVIAGFKDGKRFLGEVDMYGTKYEKDHIVTGMASKYNYKLAYMCRAIISNYWNPEIDE